MTDLLEFLSDNFLQLLFLVVGVVTFLVTFVRTGSVKKAINNFIEVDDLKNKYQTADKRLKSSQTFSETVPDYILNPATNELERTLVDKNIQEKIQSYVDTALQRALEKFMPSNVVSEVDDVTDKYQQSVTDLASLADSIELAETYRERYNLSSNMSISDIYSFVDKKAKEYKVRLGELTKKESKEDAKKEETSEKV